MRQWRRSTKTADALGRPVNSGSPFWTAASCTCIFTTVTGSRWGRRKVCLDLASIRVGGNRDVQFRAIRVPEVCGLDWKASASYEMSSRTVLICPFPARVAARQPSNPMDLSLTGCPRRPLHLGRLGQVRRYISDAAEHHTGSADHVRRWNHPGMLAYGPRGRPRTRHPYGSRGSLRSVVNRYTFEPNARVGWHRRPLLSIWDAERVI